ncbi:MAG: FtsW/RodA/SpoVE family cell cycle protein [Phycisphaerae bacterium]|nr:FtsW/RodA/SpoVE family cell cycle protein [Phycisphaerae bacterium]
MSALLSTRRGWIILLPVLPLCVAGLLTIQATNSSDQSGQLADETVRQIAFAAAGIGCMILTATVGYLRIGRFSYIIFGLSILVLVCLVIDRWVDLPFVPVKRNTRRWIQFGGLQVQPSEMMKIAYVLALAWYLRYRSNYRTLLGLVPPFLLTLVPMGLIKLQPDLGTLLLFLPVLFVVLYTAGAKAKHLLAVIVMGLLCSPLFWTKIEPYQQLRITSVMLQNKAVRDYLSEPMPSRPDLLARWEYFRPQEFSRSRWMLELVNWENVTGYQLTRSKIAIGSGGPFGQGTGRGIFVEYDFLPEKHNDFIFAMIGHQWGIIGGLLTLACYSLIAVFGYEIAVSTREPFGRLVAIGLTTMLTVQAITNICMAVGLGPVTGVPLPFVSAGGSSLVINFISLGLIVSVARHRPLLFANRPFEFSSEEEEP